jgi:hypothetical protein
MYHETYYALPGNGDGEIVDNRYYLPPRCGILGIITMGTIVPISKVKK